MIRIQVPLTLQPRLVSSSTNKFRAAFRLLASLITTQHGRQLLPLYSHLGSKQEQAEAKKAACPSPWQTDYSGFMAQSCSYYLATGDQHTFKVVSVLCSKVTKQQGKIKEWPDKNSFYVPIFIFSYGTNMKLCNRTLFLKNQKERKEMFTFYSMAPQSARQHVPVTRRRSHTNCRSVINQQVTITKQTRQEQQPGRPGCALNLL